MACCFLCAFSLVSRLRSMAISWEVDIVPMKWAVFLLMDTYLDPQNVFFSLVQVLSEFIPHACTVWCTKRNLLEPNHCRSLLLRKRLNNLIADTYGPYSSMDHQSKGPTRPLPFKIWVGVWIGVVCYNTREVSGIKSKKMKPLNQNFRKRDALIK